MRAPMGARIDSQIVGVAGVLQGLQVAAIRAAGTAVVDEDGGSGELYPHVHGPIEPVASWPSEHIVAPRLRDP